MEGGAKKGGGWGGGCPTSVLAWGHFRASPEKQATAKNVGSRFLWSVTLSLAKIIVQLTPSWAC